jgi:hypothetical protein
MIATIMAGCAEGVSRERRQARWDIYHTAVLQRIKKLPPYKTFVEPPKAGKDSGRIGQSPAEIFAAMRRLTGSPAPAGASPL